MLGAIITDVIIDRDGCLLASSQSEGKGPHLKFSHDATANPIGQPEFNPGLAAGEMRHQLFRPIRPTHLARPVVAFSSASRRSHRYSTSPGGNPPPEPNHGFKVRPGAVPRLTGQFPAWRSFAFTALCGAGLLYYFYGEKERLESKRKSSASLSTPEQGCV